MRVYTTTMRFIWNLSWMTKVYDYICDRYDDDRPSGSIELLEKILFIMQVEFIKNKKSPFIECKIYIHNNKIRIPYISDLLRTFPITNMGGYSSLTHSEMEIYIKQYNHYVKWNEEKIDDTIERIFREVRLPEKYFTYGSYKNCWIRRYARLRLRRGNYRIRALTKMLIGFGLCIPLLFFGIPLFFIEYIKTGEDRLKRDIFNLIPYTVFFIIIYIIWTCLWCRPTKFEIKNGYLEEYKNEDIE